MEKTDIKSENNDSRKELEEDKREDGEESTSQFSNKFKTNISNGVNEKNEKKNHSYRKFNTEHCDNNMTFEECELAILRHAVDENEEVRGKKEVHSEEVQNIISIVEDFISSRGLMCYGGTAINNILPEDSQFYNKDIEIPDYDFYSKTAMEHAKELADIYAAKGFSEVEAKSGVHEGTFKVFVNAIGVADITQIHPDLFDSLKKESIAVNGISYAPPNFLRMGMYLELSRPEGDISRWEKVFKRLTLLNKHYPLYTHALDKKCQTVDFQRAYRSSGQNTKKLKSEFSSQSQELYYLIRDEFISQGLVFVGGYAASLYTKYMDKNQQRYIREIPDFDVLSEDPEKSATLAKEKLEQNGYKNVKLVKHTALGEVIPESIQVLVDKETVALIYRPLSCHNYNEIHPRNKTIRIATIDTLLSFYLAFLYANKSYLDKDRILCMAAYLFKVEEKNRLEQTGLLKRFSMSCYGKQETLATMREKKSRIYLKYKNNKNAEEYQVNFLKYIPKKNGSAKTETSPKEESENSPRHFSLSKTMKTFKNKTPSSEREDSENPDKSLEDTVKSSPTKKNEKDSHPQKNKKQHANKTKKLFNFSKLGKFLWK